MIDKDELDLKALLKAHHLLFRASNRLDASRLLDKFLSYLKTETVCTVVDIQPTKGRISIDVIRRIKPLLKLDTQDSDLVISIADAQTMTSEAQSALLKLLEEVPMSTRLVFAGDYSTPLLPTILSRLQIVNFVPPEIEEGDEAKKKLYRASGFSLAELATFGDPNNQAVQAAKSWLGASVVKRLAINQKFSETDSAISLAKAIQLMLYGTVLNKLTTDNKATLGLWLNKLEAVGATLSNLQLGGNVRLNLVTLALKI